MEQTGNNSPFRVSQAPFYKLLSRDRWALARRAWPTFIAFFIAAIGTLISLIQSVIFHELWGCTIVFAIITLVPAIFTFPTSIFAVYVTAYKQNVSFMMVIFGMFGAALCLAYDILEVRDSLSIYESLVNATQSTHPCVDHYTSDQITDAHNRALIAQALVEAMDILFTISQFIIVIYFIFHYIRQCMTPPTKEYLEAIEKDLDFRLGPVVARVDDDESDSPVRSPVARQARQLSGERL